MDVEVRAWAPAAGRVDAVVGEECRAMTAEPGGWFGVRLPAGTDYLLSVDGGPGRPDPRALWQPFGVHGPSRAVEARDFPWTDALWAGSAALGEVFYELHIGTFTPQGTLDAAIGKLGHLVELGVGVVELMPVAAFPGERGWGYDGVGLYAVQHAYGGPRALQRFVDAAHRAGLGVCLDVVYNHLGPAGNYLSEFGPYFTDRHRTPWGAALNLDGEESGPVRRFILDNARQWFADFHLDALRLDAVHAIADDSPLHILAELSQETAVLEEQLGRRLTLIAESDLNDPAMVTPVAAGGLGMDAQWADDVHHALHSWVTGESFGIYVDFLTPEVLAHTLTRVFRHEGGWSQFRRQNWGRPVPAEVDRRRFVAFTQNHDQVGNRALGDRPEASQPPGRVAGSAAIVLLSPFTPLLFHGQEWGARTPFQFFTDHEPELGALVREGRLREFAQHGWKLLYGGEVAMPDPQEPATFEACKLQWEDLAEPGHSRMLRWYQDLIALRAREFGDGAAAQAVWADFGEGWFRMRRGALDVVLSPGPGEVLVPNVDGTLELVFGSAVLQDGGLRLGPAAVAVVRR